MFECLSVPVSVCGTEDTETDMALFLTASGLMGEW